MTDNAVQQYTYVRKSDTSKKFILKIALYISITEVARRIALARASAPLLNTGALQKASVHTVH